MSAALFVSKFLIVAVLLSNNCIVEYFTVAGRLVYVTLATILYMPWSVLKIWSTDIVAEQTWSQLLVGCENWSSSSVFVCLALTHIVLLLPLLCQIHNRYEGKDISNHKRNLVIAGGVQTCALPIYSLCHRVSSGGCSHCRSVCPPPSPTSTSSLCQLSACQGIFFFFFSFLTFIYLTLLASSISFV